MGESQQPGLAYCKVSAAGAFLPAAVSVGFNTPARTGAGVYTVKSDRTYANLDQYKILAGVVAGAGSANVQVTSADGITWNVTTFLAAVATDEIWWLEITPVFF